MNVKKLAVYGGGSLALFLFGVGVGTSGQPEPTVETKTVTQTETVEVEKTPQACLDALTASERLTHEAMIPYIESTVDLMYSAQAWDADGIAEFADSTDALTELVSEIVADYNVAAEQCRAAS